MMNAEPPVRLSRLARNIPRNGSRLLARKVELLKNEGKEILHLTSAPVATPGSHVIAAAVEAAQGKKRASSRGFPEFREAIAKKMARENGIVCDPDTDILPTNGSMHAIFLSLAATIDPGQEVLLIAPCFYYADAVQMAGGVSRFVAMDPADRFRIDMARIEDAITPNTRAVIWNTPVNPTGYVATEAETRKMAELAEKHDLTIIADEAFEKWVFDGLRHLSIGALPEARERVMTVHSFSKNYAMARWRLGYLVAPGGKVDYIQKILEHSLLECNSIGQAAAAAALDGPQDWVDALAEKVRNQRDRVCEGLESVAPLSFHIPQGGPNAYIDVRRLTEDSRVFSDFILKKYGIPAVPGEAFGVAGHIRFCYAGDAQPLQTAMDRMQSAVRQFPE
jgi:aspartate/methionine/tyrosine aminotransferase